LVVDEGLTSIQLIEFYYLPQFREAHKEAQNKAFDLRLRATSSGSVAEANEYNFALDEFNRELFNLIKPGVSNTLGKFEGDNDPDSRKRHLTILRFQAIFILTKDRNAAIATDFNEIEIEPKKDISLRIKETLGILNPIRKVGKNVKKS
jgi:hypothetical protein